MKTAGTTLFLLIALILIQDIYCTNSETSKANDEDNVEYVDDPDFHEYQAYIVSETNNGNVKCGGSIISQRYILTAASCVDGAWKIKVRTGIHNISEPEKDNPYIEGYSTIHPDYDPKNGLDFNIALIKLHENIPLGVGDVWAIHLARVGTKVSYGSNVGVTGWSITTANKTEVAELKQVHLTVLPHSACGKRNTEDSYCTESVKVCRNVCQSFAGDAGILYQYERYRQVGVMAPTSKDGCDNGPSVFVNVASNKIRNWIRQFSGI